jgi:hypothetical protein
MAKNHLPWLMGKQSKLCLAENFRQVKSIGKRFNLSEILYLGCINCSFLNRVGEGMVGLVNLELNLLLKTLGTGATFFGREQRLLLPEASHHY